MTKKDSTPHESERADGGRSVAAPPRLSRGKRIAFTLIMLFVTWGVLEGLSYAYLRITRGYDGKHLYEFDFDPYKNILPARNFVDTRGVRHNAQGFRRDSIVSRAKPPGTYRIFLMGGSTAYGIGGLWKHLQRDFAVIENSETIDAYLQAKLRAAIPDRNIEVINAAITSTWTHHHLIYLNQTILGFDPDMVLFLDGFNDFYFTDRTHDQFESYTYNLQSRTIMGDPTMGALVQANAWWVFRKTPLGYVLGRAVKNVGLIFDRKNPPRPWDVEGHLAALREVFPKNALRMHRRSGIILKDEGVIPVFMLQPMLLLDRARKPMAEMEAKLKEFNVSSFSTGYPDFVDRAVEYIVQTEGAMAKEIGAHFIDLTPIYRDVPEQIYTDYVHLTPRGNERLADAVADRIIGVIRADIDGRCPRGLSAPPCGG